MVAVSACCAVSLPSAACTTSCSSRVSPVFRIQFWPGRRQWSCGIYLSKGRAVEEVAENKELKDEGHVLRRVAVLASDMGVEKEGVQSRSFLNVQAGEELLTCIRNGLESGNIPPNIAVGMEELYRNYRNAVLQSGSPLADKIILSNMSVALDRILLDAEDPFTFPPHHKAVQQPFDYYMFGLNYFRPLIDFRRSYVGNIHILNEIEEKLHQGHNIILIANHQTEADPAIISLLLESTNPYIAKETTYVAGDRVVTDPLCKPFSMGRNLLCVYSKRHLYDTPELAEMKMRANTRSLKAMALLLRATGQIIWIAPSGGRDRPDPVTGEWYPAPFDASSIDNMRRLADHSGVPGHIYPFSLLCYDVMPPPPQVEKKIGECRKISFHGVGLSVCPEVHFDKFLGDSENPEKAKVAFSQALYDSVTGQYKVLKSAVYGHKGLDASNSIVSLSQPWQ